MSLSVIVASRLRRKVDLALLRRAGECALRREGIKHALVEIEVAGGARMRRYNREYLRHDYVTDVLSFPLGQTPEGGPLGCVIVCPDAARTVARQENISEREELARYVVHGTLHLLGYDDGDEPSRRRMWTAQERIVAAVMAPSSLSRKGRIEKKGE